MTAQPYYLGPNGERIEYENLSSHIGIATQYINDHPEIKAEYEKSGVKYPTDFLIEIKGFIQVTDEVGNGFYNNKIVFASSKMTPKQKAIVMEYISEGYIFQNVDQKSKNSVVQRFHDFK